MVRLLILLYHFYFRKLHQVLELENYGDPLSLLLAPHLTHTSRHMAYTLHKGAKEVTSLDEKVFL